MIQPFLSGNNLFFCVTILTLTQIIVKSRFLKKYGKKDESYSLTDFKRRKNPLYLVFFWGAKKAYLSEKG